MNQPSFVEQLFNILDQTTQIIQNNEKMTYLDALILTGENIYTDQIEQKNLIGKLSPLYDDFFHEEMTREDIRRGFQLAVLKGMKSDASIFHQMTPDSVALFIGYIAEKISAGREDLEVLDLAGGTGNLLTAMLNQMPAAIHASTVEVDDTFIKLATTNANLQQLPIEAYHQDSLRPLYVNPADLTVCDLPVGFYPDKENAANFTLSDVGEAPLSHFLMIEQGLRYTKAGGYNIYVIPNDLFVQDEEKRLYTFLNQTAFILGLLQLPATLFKDQSQAKSILILRKQGGNAVPPQQALLANLPSFSNANAILKITDEMNHWFNQYFNEIGQD